MMKPIKDLIETQRKYYVNDMFFKSETSLKFVSDKQFAAKLKPNQKLAPSEIKNLIKHVVGDKVTPLRDAILHVNVFFTKMCNSNTQKDTSTYNNEVKETWVNIQDTIKEVVRGDNAKDILIGLRMIERLFIQNHLSNLIILDVLQQIGVMTMSGGSSDLVGTSGNLNLNISMTGLEKMHDAHDKQDYKSFSLNTSFISALLNLAHSHVSIPTGAIFNFRVLMLCLCELMDPTAKLEAKTKIYHDWCTIGEDFAINPASLEKCCGDSWFEVPEEIKTRVESHMLIEPDQDWIIENMVLTEKYVSDLKPTKSIIELTDVAASLTCNFGSHLPFSKGFENLEKAVISDVDDDLNSTINKRGEFPDFSVDEEDSMFEESKAGEAPVQKEKFMEDFLETHRETIAAFVSNGMTEDEAVETILKAQREANSKTEREEPKKMTSIDEEDESEETEPLPNLKPDAKYSVPKSTRTDPRDVTPEQNWKSVVFSRVLSLAKDEKEFFNRLCNDRYAAVTRCVDIIDLEETKRPVIGRLSGNLMLVWEYCFRTNSGILGYPKVVEYLAKMKNSWRLLDVTSRRIVDDYVMIRTKGRFTVTTLFNVLCTIIESKSFEAMSSVESLAYYELLISTKGLSTKSPTRNIFGYSINRHGEVVESACMKASPSLSHSKAMANTDTAVRIHTTKSYEVGDPPAFFKLILSGNEDCPNASKISMAAIEDMANSFKFRERYGKFFHFGAGTVAKDYLGLMVTLTKKYQELFSRGHLYDDRGRTVDGWSATKATYSIPTSFQGADSAAYMMTSGSHLQDATAAMRNILAKAPVSTSFAGFVNSEIERWEVDNPRLAGIARGRSVERQMEPEEAKENVSKEEAHGPPRASSTPHRPKKTRDNLEPEDPGTWSEHMNNEPPNLEEEMRQEDKREEQAENDTDFEFNDAFAEEEVHSDEDEDANAETGAENNRDQEDRSNTNQSGGQENANNNQRGNQNNQNQSQQQQQNPGGDSRSAPRFGQSSNARPAGSADDFARPEFSAGSLEDNMDSFYRDCLKINTNFYHIDNYTVDNQNQQGDTDTRNKYFADLFRFDERPDDLFIPRTNTTENVRARMQQDINKANYQEDNLPMYIRATLLFGRLSNTDLERIEKDFAFAGYDPEVILRKLISKGITSEDFQTIVVIALTRSYNFEKVARNVKPEVYERISTLIRQYEIKNTVKNAADRRSCITSARIVALVPYTAARVAQTLALQKFYGYRFELTNPAIKVNATASLIDLMDGMHHQKALLISICFYSQLFMNRIISNIPDHREKSTDHRILFDDAMKFLVAASASNFIPRNRKNVALMGLHLINSSFNLDPSVLKFGTICCFVLSTQPYNLNHDAVETLWNKFDTYNGFIDWAKEEFETFSHNGKHITDRIEEMNAQRIQQEKDMAEELRKMEEEDLMAYNNMRRQSRGRK